jgi:hypothetical protein
MQIYQRQQFVYSRPIGVCAGEIVLLPFRLAASSRLKGHRCCKGARAALHGIMHAFERVRSHIGLGIWSVTDLQLKLLNEIFT